MNYIAEVDSKGYYNAKAYLPGNSRDVIIYMNNGISPMYTIGHCVITYWIINNIYINNTQVIAWSDIPKYNE